ncbi:MAG: alkaline phosphatase family protein [Deltaproteobacteria bacterium]
MGCLFVFVDGVGIGANDPARNPLARLPSVLSQFEDGTGSALPRGGRFDALDATLGVAGRPQSATGHTAILTGENAPALLGRHLLGFPNDRLRALLAERSIFTRLWTAGRRARFLNGYPVGYLDALGLPHAPLTGPPEPALPERAKRLRPAAAPFAVAAAGGLLATFDDVRAGRALTHDLTGELARRRWPGLPERSPEDAAQIAASESGQADFTMFDFFQTDDAGHARDFDLALAALSTLDRFLRRLIELLPLDRTSLFVTSDHGNLEDLSTRSHTLAKVPLLRFGPAAATAPPARLDELLPLLLHASGAPT